jgi:hypothetical protein
MYRTIPDQQLQSEFPVVGKEVFRQAGESGTYVLSELQYVP